VPEWCESGRPSGGRYGHSLTTHMEKESELS